MEITEQKLLKLTSTLLLDFCQCQMLSRNFENMTVADLTNYCRGWIKQNVKEFNDALVEGKMYDSDGKEITIPKCEICGSYKNALIGKEAKLGYVLIIVFIHESK